MTDIFISYASEDRSRVEPLAKALEDQGWTVFWDRTIPAGKTWRQVIGEALETARSVIVAWSNSSVESSWVQEEADSGRERNILIPILIDNVKPPLGFGAIQAADLISWEPTQSSPEFEKLISDLSAILGPSPLKVRETEQKRAEEEPRHKQGEERDQNKEEQRKTEEEREREDPETKRKAEEEQKRKVLKAEIKPDEPEPFKIRPSETKPDAKAPTEPRPSAPIPRKSRGSRNALIFGAVAGVIVLLMTGGWLYYKYEKTETISKIEGFKEKVEALKDSAADIDSKEQLEKYASRRKDLSDQVEGISEKAARFGLASQFEELQNLLRQVQIREETLFKIEGIKEQVKELEGAVAAVDKLEQIKNLYSQRDTLNKQIATLNEQATGFNLESQLEKLQTRLEQVQILKQEIRIKIERFYKQIEELERSAAKIDNQEQLEGLYRQRDNLNSQVAALNEQATQVGLGPQLVELQDRLKKFNIQLANKEKELIAAQKGRLFVETIPEDATVRILNIKPQFSQGMELDPDSYHLEVAAAGYETQRRWVDLAAGHEEPFRFELTKIEIAGPISPQKAITNSIGMKFVRIQAGSFIMGSRLSPEEVARRYGGEAKYYNDEQPPHPVKITKPFYLQTTEVSQGQWKKVMGNNPSSFNNCGVDCPVETVSWNDALEFISKLNQMEGTNKYRLPTEAEWEYACRAGTTTAFSFGDEVDQIGAYAWYKDNSELQTHSVGQKSPNPWGLYDMHGNVLEWCQDWYGYYSSSQITDPKGFAEGEERVLRGGSWNHNAWLSRSAHRRRGDPNKQYATGGFRVAMDF